MFSSQRISSGPLPPQPIKSRGPPSRTARAQVSGGALPIPTTSAGICAPAAICAAISHGPCAITSNGRSDSRSALALASSTWTSKRNAEHPRRVRSTTPQLSQPTAQCLMNRWRVTRQQPPDVLKKVLMIDSRDSYCLLSLAAATLLLTVGIVPVAAEPALSTIESPLESTEFVE